MDYSRSFKKQSGIALVVGLILLLVSTLAAVAAFQGTMFQERMTSNQYNKAKAFMVAEHGGAELLTYLRTNGAADLTSGTWQTLDNTELTWQTLVGDRAYSVYIKDKTEEVLDVIVAGVARSPNDVDLAETWLGMQVKMIYQGPSGGGGSAINLVGPLEAFEYPNSNSLKVIGPSDGPAVSVYNPGDRDEITESLTAMKRIDNYVGDPPIGIGDFSRTPDEEGNLPFWGSATSIEEFISDVCAIAPDRCGPTLPAGTVTKDNQVTPSVTVVTNDLPIEFKGNDSGSGILIVTGDLVTKGTPSWDGIILVLGGSFTVVGGGNGGVDGTVYVLNMENGTNGLQFNQTEGVSFETLPPESRGNSSGGGGGTADYIHNCTKIGNALNLGAGLAAKYLDKFGCPGGSSNPTGPPDDITVQKWIEVLELPAWVN